MHSTRNKGFALPTVLIASVVLLSILVASVTATAAVRTSLKNQYYTQLAQEAGEAGVAYAKACLAQNENEPTWSDTQPLRPNTDCNGNAFVSCPGDSRCFVAENGNIRSSFSVGMPTVDANGKAVTIPNSGYVEIIRTSTGLVWRTYTQPTVQAAVVPDLCSGQATSSLGWNSASVVTSNLTTSAVDDASPIAINSSNSVYPGPQYFRKDFSVVSSGGYVVSSAAAATQSIYIDGETIASPTTSNFVRNVVLDVGCHTIEVRLLNESLSPSGSELRLTIRKEGTPTSVVRTDSSWRATAGGVKNYTYQDYYVSPAGWSVVRDLQSVSTLTTYWAARSGDAFARFISTTHSASGTAYPGGQYVLLRDARKVIVNTPTEVDISSMCDDRCDIFLDGNLIQTNTWFNVATSTITLSEGAHQFSAWLLNYGTTPNNAGFALTVRQKNNNAILTRSDNRWLATTSWVSSLPNHSSYSKDYLPVPTEVAVEPVAQVLVVAGGGGAGLNAPGGGGGGGVIYNEAFPLTIGNTAVVVGGGGAGAPNITTVGYNGGNSSFGSLLAIGGGGGASRDGGANAGAGGSGGGGAGAITSPRHVGGAGTANQGSAGGNGTTPDAGCNSRGGGGGGAGGIGGAAVSAGPAGDGGAGYISYISGSRVGYGGGGGGGITCSGTDGNATDGGGSTSASGTPATGGGGGPWGGAGGSGVVIIAYPTGSVTATGGTITTANGMTIHKFTSNGTFTVTAIN